MLLYHLYKVRLEVALFDFINGISLNVALLLIQIEVLQVSQLSQVSQVPQVLEVPGAPEVPEVPGVLQLVQPDLLRLGFPL